MPRVICNEISGRRFSSRRRRLCRRPTTSTLSSVTEGQNEKEILYETTYGFANDSSLDFIDTTSNDRSSENENYIADLCEKQNVMTGKEKNNIDNNNVKSIVSDPKENNERENIETVIKSTSCRINKAQEDDNAANVTPPSSNITANKLVNGRDDVVRVYDIGNIVTPTILLDTIPLINNRGITPRTFTKTDKRSAISVNNHESIESQIQQLRRNIQYHEEQIIMNREKIKELLLLKQEQQQKIPKQLLLQLSKTSQPRPDKEVNDMKWKTMRSDDNLDHNHHHHDQKEIHKKHETKFSNKEHEIDNSKTCDNTFCTTSIAATIPPTDNTSATVTTAPTIYHLTDNQYQDDTDTVYNNFEEIHSTLLENKSTCMKNQKDENTMNLSQTDHQHLLSTITSTTSNTNNKTKQQNVIQPSVEIQQVLQRPMSILAKKMFNQSIKKKQHKRIYNNSDGSIMIESTGAQEKTMTTNRGTYISSNNNTGSGLPIKNSVIAHINHDKLCNNRKRPNDNTAINNHNEKHIHGSNSTRGINKRKKKQKYHHNKNTNVSSSKVRKNKNYSSIRKMIVQQNAMKKEFDLCHPKNDSDEIAKKKQRPPCNVYIMSSDSEDSDNYL